MVRVSLQTYEHLNIRDGDGYGAHPHDNHDHINIIIQGACHSKNL